MDNPFEAIDARLSSIEALLHDLKSSHSEGETATPDDVLTVQQAAAFLHLSVPTIYGLIHRNELPVMKRGKRCYFSKAELLQYLKEGRRKTATELAEEATAYCGKHKKGGRNERA